MGTIWNKMHRKLFLLAKCMIFNLFLKAKIRKKSFCLIVCFGLASFLASLCRFLTNITTGAIVLGTQKKMKVNEIQINALFHYFIIMSIRRNICMSSRDEVLRKAKQRQLLFCKRGSYFLCQYLIIIMCHSKMSFSFQLTFFLLFFLSPFFFNFYRITIESNKNWREH